MFAIKNNVGSLNVLFFIVLWRYVWTHHVRTDCR